MPFSKHELQPSTGHPEPIAARCDDDAEISRRAGAFFEIFIANPVHRAPFEAMDRLRAATAGRRGLRQYAIRVTGASGSGKSTLAKHFTAKVTARGRHPEGDRPVVYVELEQACTVKRMWSAILRAYDDDFCDDGSLEDLRKRALQEISDRRTTLLIIDEVQHLFHRSKDGLAATDAFKRLLDAGVVSVALLGDEDGRRLLESNVQLVNRMVAPADVRPLQADSPADLKLLEGFLGRYDSPHGELRLHDEPAGLHDPRIVAALMDVSGGVMGVAVNVVREASDAAHLRGASRIEPCDLARAAQAWAVGQNRLSHNPFVA